MLGFAYIVSDYWRSTPSPSYEAVRRARPLVVNNLRAFYESTKMFLAATGGCETKCVVYAAINKVNNKIYVGMTSRGLAERIRGHKASARRGGKSLFWAALRKYGVDGFDFIIVCRCRNFQHALEQEQNAIASIMPEYNMTAGGEGNDGRVASITEWNPSPDETKTLLEASGGKVEKRNKKIKKGRRPKSSEHKAKISAFQKKYWDKMKRDGNFMKDYSERMSRLTKISNMGKAKKVVCVTDDNRVFESVNAAARFYNRSTSSIIYSCKKKGGFKNKTKLDRFAYVDDLR